jgi:hypothetical protein
MPPNPAASQARHAGDAATNWSYRMPAKPACFPVPSCHAGPRCRHAPCFRLELHDPSGEIIGGKVADACAYHLGDAVQALACWAAARHLTAGSLRAYAIDVQARAASGRQEPLLASFPFASIPLAS